MLRYGYHLCGAQQWFPTGASPNTGMEPPGVAPSLVHDDYRVQIVAIFYNVRSSCVRLIHYESEDNLSY